MNRRSAILLGIVVGVVVSLLAYVFSQRYVLSKGIRIDSKLVQKDAEDPTIGLKSAKVKIVEFSDFTCPHCARFALEAFPRIYEEYVKTGKVQLTFKHFLISHFSIQPALASRCAHEQGKFWEYHEELFKQLLKAGPPAFNKENFLNIAKELGLDVEKFKQCYESNRYIEAVRRNHEEGRSMGVQGTPTFLINGDTIYGYPSYESIKAVIDMHLSG